MKIYTSDEAKDTVIGVKGTPARDEFEFELPLDILGKVLKSVRTELNLTQEEFGKLVGVQKSQISKVEKNASNVTIHTVSKVFTA